MLSEEEPAQVRGLVLKRASLWHDLNTDWFSLVDVKGRGGVLLGDSREGSSHLTLLHVAMGSWGNAVRKKGKDTRSHNMPDSTVYLSVCFHFPWNKTLDHMFSFNRQLSRERAGVRSVCQMITGWLVKDPRARFISGCSKIQDHGGH